jgi:tetratricopeptide (TPR) repeat protein
MAAMRRAASTAEAGLAEAIAHYNAGRRAVAEVLCRRLLAAQGAHPALLQLLAVLCHERADLAGARAAIDDCLRLRPGHVPSLMIAALVCQDQHDLAGAEAALRAVLAQQPEHVPALVNQGIVHLAQGRLADAMPCFGAAYRARPEAFGRIAGALCADACGALWTDAQVLRDTLSAA